MKKPNSVGKLAFASFFGLILIVVSFSYSTYRFNKFAFFNFEYIILYTKDDVFRPSQDKYLLLLYSSKKNSIEKLLPRLNTKEFVVLAVDLSQNVRKNGKRFIGVTGGFDELLKIINKLHLKHTPSCVLIKREKKSIYKQDTLIEML